jgi:hypothetical protein
LDLTGEYQNNKRHGKGKDTDKAGNCYDGQFANGDFVRGKVFYSNDDIYVGEFKDDMRHGVGRMIRFDDGAEFEGLWECDMYLGEDAATTTTATTPVAIAVSAVGEEEGQQGEGEGNGEEEEARGGVYVQSETENGTAVAGDVEAVAAEATATTAVTTVSATDGVVEATIVEAVATINDNFTEVAANDLSSLSLQ